MPVSNVDYPQGKGAPVSRYIRDILVEFGVPKFWRQRVPVANLVVALTAFTPTPGLPGVRWRLIDALAIAIGGNATTSTSANISSIVSGAAVELTAFAIAGLAQSVVLRMGAANAAVLANGASLVQNDANAALGFKLIGGTMTVATHIDFHVYYVADPQ
jgi:hypothetical protein